MNAEVKKMKSGYRVVDDDTGRLMRSVHGKPLDGGGHTQKAKAVRQCGHINDGMNEKRR